MSGVLVHDRDDGRVITFDRPATLNAFTLEDLADARAAVIEAADAGRTVVFAGSGERAFSAGMNLDVFAEIVADPDLARHHIGAVRDLLHTVRTAEVVTIASINGHCLGAAFELALACDFRLAVAGCTLGLPEMALGLPCILDAALLSQYVGLSLAKELILTGRRAPADELARHGALTECADATELRARTDALLASFADVPTAGIASQKRLFEAWQTLSMCDSEAVSLDEIDGVFHDEPTRRRITTYTDELRSRQR